MRVIVFSLAVLACNVLLAQQPGGLLARPLVYPGSAYDQARVNQYPGQYAYPRRKAWSQQDRLLDMYDFDAMTRRYDTMLRQGPGVTTFQDYTPQPWMYPWLFR